MLLTPAEIKPKSLESRWNSFFFFYPGGCASCLHACLGAGLLPRSYQYQNLLEGTDCVGGQLRGDKECPFSDVTKSGRVWRKVPESGCLSRQSFLVQSKSCLSGQSFLVQSKRSNRETIPVPLTKWCQGWKKQNIPESCLGSWGLQRQSRIILPVSFRESKTICSFDFPGFICSHFLVLPKENSDATQDKMQMPAREMSQDSLVRSPAKTATQDKMLIMLERELSPVRSSTKMSFSTWSVPSLTELHLPHSSRFWLALSALPTLLIFGWCHQPSS